MDQRTWELQVRTRKFADDIQKLCGQLSDCPAATRVGNQLRRAADAIHPCYAVACRSDSREEFIDRISVVRSHARKATRLLRRLLDSNYLRIETARDIVLESRALTAIFEASRNTAKRRLQKATAKTQPPTGRCVRQSVGAVRTSGYPKNTA